MPNAVVGNMIATSPVLSYIYALGVRVWNGILGLWSQSMRSSLSQLSGNDYGAAIIFSSVQKLYMHQGTGIEQLYIVYWINKPKLFGIYFLCMILVKPSCSDELNSCTKCVYRWLSSIVNVATSLLRCNVYFEIVGGKGLLAS